MECEQSLSGVAETTTAAAKSASLPPLEVLFYYGVGVGVAVSAGVGVGVAVCPGVGVADVPSPGAGVAVAERCGLCLPFSQP